MCEWNKDGVKGKHVQFYFPVVYPLCSEQNISNDMIANPDKFKTIVLTETDHNTAGIRLEFSRKTILFSNEIDLPGVTTDTKLSFDSHITKILMP